MKEKKQLFKEIPIDKLKEIFSYCKETGELKLNSISQNSKLNFDNNFSVWFNIDKKQYKAQAIELAFALVNNKFSSFKIRTKDLDNSNLKYSNLIDCTYEQDKAIRTALLNLRKYLKVKPTAFDQNRFEVQMYNDMLIKRRFESSDAANSFVRKSKLMFMKSLERCSIDVNSPYLY